MTVSDRLALFLREKKISQKVFCDATGYGEKNVSNFLNGTIKSPRMELITGIIKSYPELSINWLLLGEGPMWNEEYVKSGKLKKDVSVPTDGLRLIGATSSDSELIASYKQMIKNQEKLIHHLEERLNSLLDK